MQLKLVSINNEKCVSFNQLIFFFCSGGSIEINAFEDIDKFRNTSNASSVMIARAAQWNSSVFRKSGKLPIDEVITDYLKYAIDYDNTFTNTKYCIQMMLRELQETPKGKRLLASSFMDEIWYLYPENDLII